MTLKRRTSGGSPDPRGKQAPTTGRHGGRRAGPIAAAARGRDADRTGSHVSRVRSMAEGDAPTRCPICAQTVLKAERSNPALLWIRCVTDGDFAIAAEVLPVMAGLPLVIRHRVLNAAILDRRIGSLPLVDGSALSRGCPDLAVAARPGGGA